MCIRDRTITGISAPPIGTINKTPIRNDAATINQKNSGFLPAEREWLTELFEGGGFRDVFRSLYPDLEMYTWWSNRGRAWEKNVGWRIDYQIATPELTASATDGSVYREERFSDHSPLIIDYDWELN